jgi:hypothetical protein
MTKVTLFSQIIGRLNKELVRAHQSDKYQKGLLQPGFDLTQSYFCTVRKESHSPHSASCTVQLNRGKYK